MYGQYGFKYKPYLPVHKRTGKSRSGLDFVSCFHQLNYNRRMGSHLSYLVIKSLPLLSSTLSFWNQSLWSKPDAMRSEQDGKRPSCSHLKTPLLTAPQGAWEKFLRPFRNQVNDLTAASEETLSEDHPAKPSQFPDLEKP